MAEWKPVLSSLFWDAQHSSNSLTRTISLFQSFSINMADLSKRLMNNFQAFLVTKQNLSLWSLFPCLASGPTFSRSWWEALIRKCLSCSAALCFRVASSVFSAVGSRESEPNSYVGQEQIPFLSKWYRCCLSYDVTPKPWICNTAHSNSAAWLWMHVEGEIPARVPSCIRLAGHLCTTGRAISVHLPGKVQTFLECKPYPETNTVELTSG